MLLNLYLGSTAFSWAVVGIYSAALKQRLKRKGYESVEDEKESWPELIMNLLSVIFKGCIPVYNIYKAVIILALGDKALEIGEQKLLEMGSIRKIETKENNDELKEKKTENIEEKEEIKDLFNDREYEDHYSNDYSYFGTNDYVKKRGLRKPPRRKK